MRILIQGSFDQPGALENSSHSLPCPRNLEGVFLVCSEITFHSRQPVAQCLFPMAAVMIVLDDTF